MARPVKISRSKFHILMMPSAYSLLLRNDELPITGWERTVFELRIYWECHKTLQKKKSFSHIPLEMVQAIAFPDRGAKPLLDWLTAEGQVLDSERYIQFLEFMMFYVLECWGGKKPNRKAKDMQPLLDNMVKIYTESIYPSYFRIIKQRHGLLWSNIDEKVKRETRLLAKGYGQFLDLLEKGGMLPESIYRLIDDQAEFRAAGVQNVKQDFRNYQDYFDDVERPKKGPADNDGPKSFNTKLTIPPALRKRLIELCAEFV